MGSVRAGPLTRLAPPKPVLRFVHRLSRQLHREPVVVPGAGDPPSRLDPLLATARRLREAREARGLTLRELAQETRISTSVLEALERAWPDRLPEAAYLRTMLTLLERHLQLAPGSLHGALPSDGERHPHPATAAGPRLNRWQPLSIQLVATWQGSLLYVLLTLGLLYALNLQQQRLAALGLLSSRPVSPRLDDGSPPAEESADLLLGGFPELKPLRRAAAGAALGRLRQESRANAVDLSSGQLRLRLDQPSEVVLTPAAGPLTHLRQARGDLSLPVLPPFRLRITPAPPAGEGGTGSGTVLWNGRPLEGRTGLYRYPSSLPPAAAKAGSDRPVGSPSAERPRP